MRPIQKTLLLLKILTKQLITMDIISNTHMYNDCYVYLIFKAFLLVLNLY